VAALAVRDGVESRGGHRRCAVRPLTASRERSAIEVPGEKESQACGIKVHEEKGGQGGKYDLRST